MKRITVRLPDLQYTALDSLAKEIGTDLSGAFRSLISSHQRTQQLLNVLEKNKIEILQAIASLRDAGTENLKRATQHLTQILSKDSL